MVEHMITASRRSAGGTIRPAETDWSLTECETVSACKSALPRPRGTLCGERLGNYQLGELVGVGGMAEVYRAQDLILGREVAVKVLAAHLADDTDYADRFRAEAHRVSSLSHPHLVPVYHAGEMEVQGRRLLYLVMPLLRESLRDRRRREGKLPVSEASRLMLQLAEGLEAAHRSGIVHRDVKPGNILLDGDGHPLLGDFGIARDLYTTSSDVAPTHTALVVGTPEYMAPEQLCGASVDQRADVYALGAVFYELLTGRLPFVGTTAYDLAAHVLHASLIPPSALEPEVTLAVERVALRALERNPAQRYATAGAFSLALRDALREQSGTQQALDPYRLPVEAPCGWDGTSSPTQIDSRDSRAPRKPAGWSAGKGRQLWMFILALGLIVLLAGFGRLLITLQHHGNGNPVRGAVPVVRAPASIQQTPAATTPAGTPAMGAQSTGGMSSGTQNSSVSPQASASTTQPHAKHSNPRSHGKMGYHHPKDH